jgi:hypothetical protein
MDMQPHAETTDELIAKVRSSRDQFEEELLSLVHETAERRTMLASLEQKVSSLELLSRSQRSEVEKIDQSLKAVGPVVLAALSHRNHRKPRWKAKVKAVPVPLLELHRNYNVVEVAAILGLQYDTALRRITSEMTFQDHGTKETRFKGPKRKLTVNGKDLAEYIRKHTKSN